MDVSTMISELNANGRVELPIAMIGDLMDIDRRAKYGDESGWRGDPTMCVAFNKETKRFEIWGIDAHQQHYMAASHDTLDTTLIRKLRDGDPRTNDVFQRVLDHNAKLVKDREAADRDKFNEVGDKLRWAINKEFNPASLPISIPRKVGA